MLNLAKVKPWLVASMLAATSLFGQQDKCKPQKSYDQDMAQAQMMPGYNAPSRIDVRGAWDFYVTGSFIYFQPTQDNMELGFSAVTATSTALGATSGSVINMGANYKPGFKVGLGMNFDYDNWDSYAEYTRLHCTENASATNETGGYLLPYRVTASYVEGTATTDTFSSLSGNWRMNLDLLDFNLGRASYVGQKLTMRSHFGGRAAWISQNYTVNRTTTSGVLSNTQETSKSWGLGLRAGMESNWNLGCGFRFFGNGAADILYTQYQGSVYAEYATTPATIALQATQGSLNTVRPHAELEFGLGWGSYFDNNNWHVDFMAGYGFQVFWDQNMLRRFTGSYGVGATGANTLTDTGNLYLQGLTITGRLDF